MNILRSDIAHTLAGVAMMGGWAAFANRGYPWPAPLVAGLVQGAITGSITFVMKRAMEWMAARTRGLLPPALTASAISATLLTTIHTIAGTPAFWATIAVPFAVATTYGFAYALTLRRGA